MEYIKTRAQKKQFQENERLKQHLYGLECSKPFKIEDEEVIITGIGRYDSLPKRTGNYDILTRKSSKSSSSSYEDDEVLLTGIGRKDSLRKSKGNIESLVVAEPSKSNSSSSSSSSNDDDSRSSTDDDDVESDTSDETYDKNVYSDDGSDTEHSSSSDEESDEEDFNVDMNKKEKTTPISRIEYNDEADLFSEAESVPEPKKYSNSEPKKMKNSKGANLFLEVESAPEPKRKSNTEPKKKKDLKDYKNESGRKRKLEAPLQTSCLHRKSKSSKIASEDCDFVGIIYNSDLDIEEDKDEQKESSQSKQTVLVDLPKKFRFHEPIEPAKTESENEVDNLFQEFNFVKCSQQVEDDGSDDEPHISEGDMTDQSRLCQIGKHELRLDEQIGEICIYCHHIPREIQDIFPELIQLKYDASDRERLVRDEHDGSIYDEFLDSAEDSRRFEDKRGTVWELLPVIHNSMYPHQKKGFEFLWKNLVGTIQLEKINEIMSNDGGCIISHAPGTGKTRMSIAFISSYLKIFKRCHPVVIAPASMLLTWEEEFKKWEVDFPFYNLNNLELSGNENKTVVDNLRKIQYLKKETRTRMVKIHSWDRNPGVLGISYTLYTKYLACAEAENVKIKKKNKRENGRIKNTENEFWVKTLLEKPGLVVLDEGHTPRVKKSGIFKILQKLRTRKRIILSGTPFQNNFKELENTLRIIQPDIADSLSKDSMFVEAKKRNSTIKNGEEWAEWLKKLNEKISPCADVYKGSILQKTLPGLSKCMINMIPGKFQKKIIDNIVIDSARTLETECMDTLVTIHPSLILKCKLSKRQEALIHSNRGKLQDFTLKYAEGVKTMFIVSLVKFSLALNEKVLIFCQFTAPLKFIMAQLNHSFNWGEEKVVKIIKGKQTLDHRQKIINDFNDPESEVKVMLASTKCCKEGISLTGASRVVLLDVVWNPSVEKQAISRAYRIGQKKMVYSYHLITETEVNKHKCQAEKDRLSKLVFCSKQNDRTILRNDKELKNDKILDAILNSELADMFGGIVYQTNLAEDS